jgi:DNA-binding NarL/FixJ family response regulator
MQIRILVTEDHEIVRHGIRALLENDPEISIIGEAANGSEALEKIKQLKPDVVLMDVNMPVMNGLECTRLAKQQFPHVKILVVSMHNEESFLIDLLDAGADGYLLKNSSKADLTFAIKKTMDQGMYISHEFTLSMLDKYKAVTGVPKKEKIDVRLSPREMEVLHLIAEGLTNIEIANKLFTSRRTVETHRKRLLEKTHTTNTATLIRFVVQNEIIH